MKKLAIPLFILLLIIISGYLFFQKEKPSNNQITPTPSTVDNKHINWKTFTDNTNRITFKYPDSLTTQYIRTQTWPPKVTVFSDNFSCKEEEQPLVMQKKIEDTTYCIENASQGAAGTIYSDYTYTFLKNGKLVKLQFTLAYPQCANYPEPQKSACELERQSFNLDGLIDQIAQTIQVGSNSSIKLKPSVTTPQPNAKVSSPLTVTGMVPTGWMFEGVFPIQLLDANKQVITETQAKQVIPGSWSSGKDVEFTATLTFTTSVEAGFIHLEKDNPSGLQQNADSFEVPVKF